MSQAALRSISSNKVLDALARARAARASAMPRRPTSCSRELMERRRGSGEPVGHASVRRSWRVMALIV